MKYLIFDIPGNFYKNIIACIKSMSSGGSEYRRVPLESLVVSQFNVRSIINPDNVRRLADNIKEVGLLEPLVVMPSIEKPGVYEVVVGRHRLEALKMIKGEDPERFNALFGDGVPCVIRELSPSEAIMISLTENLQRGDLSREEVGRAVRRLVAEYRVPIDEIVRRVKVEVRVIEEALEAVRLAKDLGAILSRPGRPPKRRRHKAVPRVAVRAAMRLSEELMEKGLEPDKAEEIRDRLLRAAAEAGLSGKEVELVTRRAEEELRRGRVPDIEALVRSIGAREKLERVVLLDRRIIDAVSSLAEERGLSFDEMLDNVIRAGLRHYGLEV